MSGLEPANPDVVGMLYRERFSLSAREMQEEPAEAVELWIALEAARAKAQEAPKTPGSKPAMGEPLDEEDL